MRLGVRGWRASTWALTHLVLRFEVKAYAYQNAAWRYACRPLTVQSYSYMSSCCSPRVGDKRSLSMTSSSTMLQSLSPSSHTSCDSIVPATACVRCLGEGSVWARPSKKARAQRKREMEAAKRRASEEEMAAKPMHYRLRHHRGL